MTTVKTGKILVFVNLGYSKLDDPLLKSNFNSDGSSTSITNAFSVDQQSGKVNVTFFGNLNLQGNSILDVGKITGYLGKWSIDENGKLAIQDLEVGGKAKFGTPENPQGITIYDKATKQPVCVYSENNILRSDPGECGSAPSISIEVEPQATAGEGAPSASSESNTEPSMIEVELQSGSSTSTATETAASANP